MNYINKIIENKNELRAEYIIDNTKIKVIGIGPKALKVLVLMPSKFTKTPSWYQAWFKYNDLTQLGKELIKVMVDSIA